MAAYIDEYLRADESAALRRHLLDCADCHEEYEFHARLNSPLRELPRLSPPPELATAIRLRLPERRTSRWERWQVHLSNMMGPIALPAAGGLLSALILFRVLMPAVSAIRAAGGVNDVPTVLRTEPRFKAASVLPLSQDMLVEAWIDEQGKVTNFEVLNPAMSEAAVGKELHNQIISILLTTLFEPATQFGQPTHGKVVLSLRRINVAG
ncbi:MAG: hypothetical protein HY236_00805 [Acidobacteria bacterium]|nr:hypothetical protein [Acidobacteriota bacterium]